MAEQNPLGPAAGLSQERLLYATGDYWSWDCADGKLRHVGCFDDEVEAARARDLNATRLRGEKAQTNFPVEEYADRSMDPNDAPIKSRPKSSSYHGVSWAASKGKWTAVVSLPGPLPC